MDSDASSEMNFDNYYSLLNISRNADIIAIKKAYIDLLHKYSPEKSPEEFKILRKAYETLKNPVTRKTYDATLKFGNIYFDLYDRAKQSFDMENYDSSINCLKKLIVLCPEIGELHYFLGISFLRINNFRQGLMQVNKAIEYEPKNPQFRHTRGMLFEEIDEKIMAEEELKYAYELDPNNIKYFFDYVNILRKYTHYDAALNMLEKKVVKSKSPSYEDTYFYFNIIRICFEMGDFDKFREVLSRFSLTSTPALCFHFAENFKPLFNYIIELGDLAYANELYKCIYSLQKPNISYEEGFNELLRKTRSRKEIDYLSADPLFPDVLLKALEELIDTEHTGENMNVNLFEDSFRANPDAAFYALQKVKVNCETITFMLSRRINYWLHQIKKWQAYQKEISVMYDDLTLNPVLRDFFRNLANLKNTLVLKNKWREVEEALGSLDRYDVKNMLYKITVCYPAVLEVHKDEILLLGKGLWEMPLYEKGQPAYCHKCGNLVFPSFYNTHRRFCRDCYNQMIEKGFISNLIDSLLNLLRKK
ncbi:MAG: DnaJ domain-containing protein [Candidatus Coatesbacteria bacterium]|nr:DnaJ domain-containing protein [Candidatus Coatesbacteria bacterium]